VTPKIIITSLDILTSDYLHHLQKTYRLAFHLQPEKKSISLLQIKSFIKQTSLYSNPSEKTLFLIEDAHAMTLPAQNCLLKTLEETLSNQLLLLSTPKIHQLLPTIISRCLIEKMVAQPAAAATPISPSLKDWSGHPGNTINLTDAILKNNPQTYLFTCLNLINANFKKNHHFSRSQILKSLLICLNDLDQNINPRLAVDHFFFSIRQFLPST